MKTQRGKTFVHGLRNGGHGVDAPRGKTQEQRIETEVTHMQDAAGLGWQRAIGKQGADDSSGNTVGVQNAGLSFAHNAPERTGVFRGMEKMLADLRSR